MYVSSTLNFTVRSRHVCEIAIGMGVNVSDLLIVLISMSYFPMIFQIFFKISPQMSINRKFHRNIAIY